MFSIHLVIIFVDFFPVFSSIKNSGTIYSMLFPFMTCDKTHIFRQNAVFFCAALLFAACASSDKPITAYAQDSDNSDITKPYLSDITLNENVNGTYPDSVFVKSLTQTFCKGYSFMLRDGKIWIKEDGDQQWSLLLKTGLPFSKKSQNIPNSGWFEQPARICEIGADGDCLFAFDENGFMYNLYTQNSTTEKPFTWVGIFGWPNKVPLSQNNPLIKNKRGWAMGVRRKDILWYEDRFGNQHHYGTMGLETLYFLTGNGQEIRFTDSGLPCDFSHSILGPERGSFTARNISVSGDTIFLIGDDGSMYTQLIDFDTMGCDPMFFKYTYVAEKQKYAGSDYRSNFTPWGLPNEDWKKQPAIPLAGRARLSRFISISQNGQGNNARELRVAGSDSSGSPGYYSKQISNDSWKFIPASVVLHEKDYLTGSSEQGKKKEYAYSGYLLKDTNMVPGIRCSVSDFTMTSCGSCTLTVSKKTGSKTESKQFAIDLVEMWTYMVRLDPGFDGTPKHFFATALFSQDECSSGDSEFDAILKDIFSGKSTKLFAFSCEATDKYVQLDTTGESKTPYIFFLNTYGGTYSPSVYKSVSVLEQPIFSKYDESDLILTDKTFYTPFDIPVIKKVIANNADYIEMLNNEIAAYDSYRVNTNVSRWGYNAMDLITSITLLNHIDFPKIKTMTRFGDQLMNTNARNFRDMYEYRSFTYPQLIELVQVRISCYMALQKELYSGTAKAYPDSRLKNTFPEYFDAVHIPHFLEGDSPSAKVSATIEQISEVPIFPGFLVTVNTEGEQTKVFIKVTDAAHTVYARPMFSNTLSALERDPLEFSASFYPLSNNRSVLEPVAGIKLLARKDGKMIWNGKTLIIKSCNKVFGGDTLFEGTVK